MDDDPMIVSALARDLADRGCIPFGTTSPAEAETLLADSKIDAMILDYDLGRQETGLDFFRRMRAAAAKEMPGLILTGGTDASTLAAVMASGVPWLTKPAEPDMIAGALAKLVAGDGTSDVHER
jgi:DNA-binding response OmpR family regulator